MTNAPLSNRQQRAWNRLHKTWLAQEPFLAIELAREYIDKYTVDSAAWTILGACLVQTCHFEEAAAAFDKAEELATQAALSGIWIERAALHESQGQPLQAEALYRKAAQADPTNSAAAVRLALVLLRHSQDSQAEKVLIDAIEREGHHPDSTHHALGIVLRSQGNLQAAQEQFEIALDINPDSPGTTLALDDVRRAQDYVLDSNSGEGHALSFAAGWKALQCLSNEDSPAYFLERARSLRRQFPDHSGVLFEIVETLAILHRHAQATKALETYEGVCSVENRYVFELFRGHAYRATDQKKEAEFCYRRAIELAPPERSFHAYLGGTLAVQGRFEEAKQAHLQAIAHPGGLADEGYFNLALIAACEVQYPEALRYSSKALALDPGYALAKEFIPQVKLAIKLQKAAKRGRPSKS